MKKIIYNLEYILILPLAIMSILSAINENFILLLVGVGLFLEAICYIFLATNNNKLKISTGFLCDKKRVWTSYPHFHIVNL